MLQSIIRTLHRWFIVVLVFIVGTAVLLGSSLQVTFSLLPDSRQQEILPYVFATGIAVAIANGVIAIMGLFGISPRDFMPERSLEETLREENSRRFHLSRAKDIKFLAEQTKRC